MCNAFGINQHTASSPAVSRHHIPLALATRGALWLIVCLHEPFRDAARQLELFDVELLVDRMNVTLAAAEGHGGEAAGGEPIGVEPAVGNGKLRFFSFASRMASPAATDRRIVFWQVKRFVIEVAVDDGSTFAALALVDCERLARCPLRNAFSISRTMRSRNLES